MKMNLDKVDKRLLHVFTIPGTPQAFFDGQFAYLRANGYCNDVVANDDFDPGFVERNGVTVFKTPIARRIAPLADLKAIAAVAGIIRRGRYDAVVGHTPKGAMVAMIAALLAGKRRRIYYRHGLVFTTARGLKRRVLKAVERLTAACATAVVNVSPSLGELAVRERLNGGRKQSVIGLGTCGGIDASGLFNPANITENPAELRTQLGIGADEFVVGFCGRLCRDKGIAELVEGFHIFTAEHPEAKARLLLIGRFDYRDALPEEVKRQITESADVISTGLMPHNRLPALYSAMDIFAFPSYREGFGMTVLEASAMEVPVIVTRSHGCVDSIREGETGEYIDLSPRGIADGIARMHADADRRRYGRNGRRFVTGHFDHPVMWPLVLDYYRRHVQ